MIGLVFSLFWMFWNVCMLLIKLLLLPLKLLTKAGNSGGSRSRSRRGGSSAPSWTHAGCTTRHRTREAAQRCTKGTRQGFTAPPPPRHAIAPPPIPATGHIQPHTVDEISHLVAAAYAHHGTVEAPRRQMLSGLIATLEWVQRTRPQAIVTKTPTINLATIRHEMVEASRYRQASDDQDLQAYLTGVIRACEWLLRMSDLPLRP